MPEIYGRITNEARRLLKDPKKFLEFCERFLYILPVSGGRLVKFKANPIQKFVFNTYILPDLLAEKPVRVLCLKARQFGMSTLAEALGMWCTIGHANWNSIVVAHKGDKSKEIFRMMRRFLVNLPKDGILPRFAIGRYTQGIIEFNVPSKEEEETAAEKYDLVLDSRIEVFSAQDRQDLGRSGTYQFAHLSEAAMWPALNDSLSSLLQACHEEPGTIVFVETTANGYNDFYDLWSDESDEYSQTMWKRVFLPWYWYDLYEKKVTDDVKFSFMDDYERDLFDKIKSDATLVEINKGPIDEARIVQKLCWRRYVIRNRFRGDIDTFKQEFPSSPSEAFKFTGIGAFTDDAIEKCYKEKKPVWVGNIDIKNQNAVELNSEFSECATSSELPNGRFKIWEKPLPDESYLICCDISEGRAVEGVAEGMSKRDFSCFHVLRLTSFPPIKDVAVWHGNIETDMLAYLLVLIARYYNNAFLSWESNMFGDAMTVIIVKRCRYINTIQREKRDSLTDKLLLVPGWETNRQTKPSMVAIGRMFMREGNIEIYDDPTRAELHAFADLGSGKFGAVKGHDDRVMALLQGLVVAEPRVDLEVRLKKSAEEEKARREEAGEQDEEMVIQRFSKDEPWNPILGNDF